MRISKVLFNTPIIAVKQLYSLSGFILIVVDMKLRHCWTHDMLIFLNSHGDYFTLTQQFTNTALFLITENKLCKLLF